MKEKLLSALKKCAKAHKANWEFSDNEWEGGLFVIMSANLPTVSDVRTIAEAFFGSSGSVYVDSSWGMTSVYFDTMPFLPKINENLLSFALPYGTKI